MLPKCALTVSSRNKSNYTHSVPLVCAAIHSPAHVDFSDVNWPVLYIFLEVEFRCWRVILVIHSPHQKKRITFLSYLFFGAYLMSEMNSIFHCEHLFTLTAYNFGSFAINYVMKWMERRYYDLLKAHLWIIKEVSINILVWWNRQIAQTKLKCGFWSIGKGRSDHSSLSSFFGHINLKKSGKTCAMDWVATMC